MATIIEIVPQRGWSPVNWRDLWEYRELLYFLIWRNIKVRYAQTLLGATWAIIQPVTNMIVFSVIFGGLAQLPSNGIPYPVFTFAALLPWNLFVGALERSGTSVVGSANLVSKVYFPRLIIPLAATFSGLVDFGIAFLVLLGLMLYFGILPTAAILSLPVFMLLALVTALGFGLWLSALHIRYRDVGYLLPFLTQVWLYASPVAYASNLIPERWRLIYGLNPMAGVVEGFRWALLGTGGLDPALTLASCVIVALLLISGFLYFRRTEATFADRV